MPSIDTPSATALRVSKDGNGGVTITLSNTDPGKGKNWLPTPKGPFFMVMRMYGPGEGITKGKWPRPEPGIVN
jgi:Uncharacterized conserved protein